MKFTRYSSGCVFPESGKQDVSWSGNQGMWKWPGGSFKPMLRMHSCVAMKCGRLIVLVTPIIGPDESMPSELYLWSPLIHTQSDSNSAFSPMTCCGLSGVSRWRKQRLENHVHASACSLSQLSLLTITSLLGCEDMPSWPGGGMWESVEETWVVVPAKPS